MNTILKHNFKSGEKWLQDINKFVAANKLDKAGKTIAQLEAHSDFLELDNGLNEIFQLKLNEALETALNQFLHIEEIKIEYVKLRNFIAVANTMFLNDYERCVYEELGIDIYKIDPSRYQDTIYFKFLNYKKKYYDQILPNNRETIRI